jgi:hypothetical protein
MAKQAPENDKLTPVYIPFATFQSFIEALKNTTIPPRIDNSVTPTMSGQMRGALTSCLRFLNLVDSARHVTPNLKPLVDAFGTDQWKEALLQVVVDAYSEITDGLDLDHATGGQLNEHFREKGGVDGQVLEKCVRFYLSALDASGVTYSPHFKTRGAKTVRKSNGPKPKVRKSKQGDLPDDEVLTVDTSKLAADGLVPFVVSFPDKAAAKFFLPKNITEDDWTLIDAIGRAYVKRTAKSVKV